MKYHNFWSCQEENNMEKFILQNSSTLIDWFYINILLGNTKWRKTSKFFKNMSDLVKRSPSQCKSKFQKTEDYIYINLLGLPKLDYNIYSQLRTNMFQSDNQTKLIIQEEKRQSKRQKRNFKNKNEENQELFERRLQIANEIRQKKIEINLPESLESKF